MFAGLGPLIAGMLCWWRYPPKSADITLTGEHTVQNLVILSLPLWAFTITGLPNKLGLNVHVFAFSFTLANLVYSSSEEFGWRLYLQNKLARLNPHLKYITIAAIWWVWHARFETRFDFFVFPWICLGGGYLLGKLADDAKSVLPVICAHTLVILITNQNALSTKHYLAVGGVMTIWFAIGFFWPGSDQVQNASEDNEQSSEANG